MFLRGNKKSQGSFETKNGPQPRTRASWLGVLVGVEGEQDPREGALCPEVDGALD